MSNASGISVSADLRSAYASARVGSEVAFLKVGIVSDALALVDTAKKSSASGLSGVFDAVRRSISSTQPAFFVVFRSKEEVLLLAWSPDDASAKDKMAYSSSKGALSNMITSTPSSSASSPSTSKSVKLQHYHASSLDELSYAAFQKHQAQENPQSEVEEALAALPRQLPKQDFSKSAGYSLLAQISGKALPTQLKNYAASSAAGNSGAASANNASSRYATKPDHGARSPVAAAFLAAANKPSAASSASSPSSSPSAAAAAATQPVRKASAGIATKCLVADCDGQRVKNGYCLPCARKQEEHAAT